MTGLITPTPGNEVYKAGSAHLTSLLQRLNGPVQLYTSLANENEEPERQKIIKPLIADLKKEISKPGKKNVVDEKYSTSVIDKMLASPNDHFNQTLGAESFVRIASQELHAIDHVPPIFSPRAGNQGRDFYFTVMEPRDVTNIFGESLGKLAQILQKKR